MIKKIFDDIFEGVFMPMRDSNRKKILVMPSRTLLFQTFLIFYLA